MSTHVWVSPVQLPGRFSPVLPVGLCDSFWPMSGKHVSHFTSELDHSVAG